MPRTRFATFERDDGRPVDLIDGYRDAVKGRWRTYWWYTQVLFGVRTRHGLPRELEELAGEIAAARTLPVGQAEIAEAIEPLADLRPEDVRRSGVVDARLGVSRLDLVPTAAEVATRVATYEGAARGVLDELARRGLDVPSARVLEIGCASGYLTFATASAGVREAIGVDVELESYVGGSERELVRNAFADGDRARLEAGDACALSYDDGSFDAVVSLSVLEHIRDVAQALRECHRVLRPGGLAYHGVDPWFSPQGGHGLCVLDFPWGHVRLTAVELSRYLRERRPHEAREALDMYEQGFQVPRLTAAELERAALDAGFEVLSRVEALDLYRNHRPLLTDRLLDECRRGHPSVRESDLFVASHTLVLRRRRAKPAVRPRRRGGTIFGRGRTDTDRQAGRRDP